MQTPLHQPISYDGKTYLTAHYFHQQYRVNSENGGKYHRVADFMRLIRSIEAYPNYVESGDIVELTWEAVKQEPGNAEFALLVRSNSYKPVMLINETAQAALTHHLDDEVSKTLSISINRHVSSGSRALETQQARAATAWLDATLKAAKLLGTDVPMARAVAVDIVKERVGVDFSKLLACNSVEESPVTPTELGKPHGWSGQKTNTILSEHGFAFKNEHGDWVPTEKGKPYCTCNPYKSPHSDHTGYRTLWYRRVLDAIFAEQAA